MSNDRPTHTRLVHATDIEGLDDILVGGLTKSRLYLIEGVPGSGKTTLALQFLRAGAEVSLARKALAGALVWTR
jgi:predicted ATP-dependent serine protease